MTRNNTKATVNAVKRSNVSTQNMIVYRHGVLIHFELLYADFDQSESNIILVPYQFTGCQAAFVFGVESLSAHEYKQELYYIQVAH